MWGGQADVVHPDARGVAELSLSMGPRLTGYADQGDKEAAQLEGPSHLFLYLKRAAIHSTAR